MDTAQTQPDFGGNLEKQCVKKSMLEMYMHERGLLMMIEQLWGSPDIFRILVPLPENPLKGLNVYVLRTKEQALVIDTGFRG